MTTKTISVPFVELRPINELEEITSLQPGNLLFEDGDGNLKRITTDVFYQLLHNIARPIAPGDTGPFTASTWYKPIDYSDDPGTNYPNAGNLKAIEGFDTLFWFGGGTTWKKAEVKLPSNSAKTVYDPTDNVNPSTMKATNDYFLNLPSTDTSVLDVVVVEKVPEKSIYSGYGHGIRNPDLEHTLDDSLNTKSFIDNTLTSVNVPKIFKVTKNINGGSGRVLAGFKMPLDNKNGVFGCWINVDDLIGKSFCPVCTFSKLGVLTGIDSLLNSTENGATSVKSVNGYSVTFKITESENKWRFVEFQMLNNGADLVYIYPCVAQSSPVFQAGNSQQILNPIGIQTNQMPGAIALRPYYDYSPDTAGVNVLKSRPFDFSNLTRSTLTNKKILWIGTSIPAGHPHTDQQDIWAYPNIIANRNGAKIYNKGVPGGYLRRYKSNGLDLPNPNLSFTNISASVNYQNTILDKIGTTDEPDIIVFDYGVNDYAADPSDIDNYSNFDMTNEDPKYFIGAFNFVIKKILQIRPNMKIVVICHFSDDSAQSVIASFSNLNRAIEKCGSYWACPTLSLYKKTGWVIKNGIDLITINIPDLVHPASASTPVMANKLADIIEGFLKTN